MIGPTQRERLLRAAHLLARYPFEFWHYGDSIGSEGLLAAGDVLNDDRFEGFVHGALKAWAGRREPFRELDNTAPGHAMCLAYERTGDEAILEAAGTLARFLLTRRKLEGAFVSFERAPLRRPYSGVPLTPDEEKLLLDPGAGIFVDCVHFDPPFFAHLGRLTGDQELIDRGAEQALAHLALLQDDETGLVWHFWLEKTRSRYGLGWARGQGWVLLGLLDLLAYLPEEDDGYQVLLTATRRLADALAERQEPSGGWPAVATDPGSGPETSTAAFAAAGFADGVRRGLLEPSFRERAFRAWAYVWEKVGEDGVLSGVSAAVWASTQPSHYAHVPTGFVVPWGQGTLLVAAQRIAQLEAAAGNPASG